MIDCRILTSAEEVEPVAAEWRELHARAGLAPFSNCDYVMNWWKTVGRTHGKRKLHIVTGRDGKRLVAVLSLTIVNIRGMRVMNAAGYKGFNFCDILCENEEYGRAVWQAAKNSPHYDFADIRDVYPESACRKILADFARERDTLDAFYMRLKWPSGKDWLASLSGNMRGNFNRCVRRMGEKGAVSFEMYRDGPLPLDVISGMVKQKKDWCIANNKSGTFDNPNAPDFFREISQAAADNGQLFLAWLKCGDTIVAYQQGYVFKGILWAAFWTYDPEWSQLSPGNVIMMSTICWAIDNGFTSVDLGQGDSANREKGESLFKFKHSNEVLQCSEFTFSNSLRGTILELVYFTARALWRKRKGQG